MTMGEYRVGIDFNPGKSDIVAQIKRAAADLIDICLSVDIASLSPGQREEVYRLMELAASHVEDGAMWAVKAVTKPVQK